MVMFLKSLFRELSNTATLTRNFKLSVESLITKLRVSITWKRAQAIYTIFRMSMAGFISGH